MPAGWRGRVGGTSRRCLLRHPASCTAPCGRVTAQLRPAALPEVSPRIRAHAGLRDRLTVAAPRDLDSDFPRGRLAAASLFFPPRWRGALLSSSGRQLPGSFCQSPGYCPSPSVSLPASCLCPRTRAEMDRGRLNQKGWTRLIP